MSLNKVVPIHPNNGTLNLMPHDQPPAGRADDGPSTAGRLRRALQEQAPAESLMGQLRDIILGPQVRLSEARFEEMLDILEEQKDYSTARLNALEESLGETVENAAEMTGALEDQQEDIFLLTGKLEDSVKTLRSEQEAALARLRSDLQLSMEMMSDTFRAQVEHLEMNMRSGLLDLSSSLVVHIAEEDKRWDREREQSLSTLEQRIAQWRAEIEDDRKSDMAELATSMMDIGQRLMALRKT